MDKHTPTPTNPDEMPLSPEEIKAIGEIELGPAKHEIFLNKHYKKLIIGGIAFMVVASAGIGYYSYKAEQQEQAGSLIVQSMSAHAPEGSVDPVKYDTAILNQVKAEFGDTNSAGLAQLLEALAMLTDSAKAERGIAQLDTLAASTTHPLLKARALASIATYYMSEEQTEKAVNYWKELIAEPANPYTAIAYLSLGDLAKQSGDIEGARTWYEKLHSACPYSPIVRENIVGLREALLEVDAPVPTATPEPEPQPTATPAPATPAPAPSAIPGANPFGIDPANPFGSTPGVPAAPSTGSEDPFGVSTLPGGTN